MMDWFARITGFRERGYLETQSRLLVQDGRLVNERSKRSWGIGFLETPSLGELRARRRVRIPAIEERLSVTLQRGFAQDLHADPSNQHAFFQVASQFNLLEMANERMTPEDGVTRYAADLTQGPACAVAAGAGTIYRNYLAPVDSGIGQTRDRQIDCLANLGQLIGNSGERLWRMRNGYAILQPGALEEIDDHLKNASAGRLDALRASLRIGLQHGVEVTAQHAVADQVVTQAYCSALPVAYNSARRSHLWARFATLILEASYEAMLLAAAEIDTSTRPQRVFLTCLGGGVFGNDMKWIVDALTRALDLLVHRGMDIRIVVTGNPRNELLVLAEKYA